jgi:hypothetical protein
MNNIENNRKYYEKTRFINALMLGRGLESKWKLLKALKITRNSAFINAWMLGKGLESTAQQWKSLKITRNLLLMRGCFGKVVKV